jgi:hypothetical protein
MQLNASFAAVFIIHDLLNLNMFAMEQAGIEKGRLLLKRVAPIKMAPP